MYGPPTRANLEDTQPLFQALTNLASLIVCIIRKDGSCMYGNPNWWAMTGLRPEEASSQNWFQAVHPEDRERVAHSWNEATQSEGEWRGEFRLENVDGKTTWVLGFASPLRIDQEPVTGYLGIHVDISALKAAENQLLASERRYAELLTAVTAYRYSVEVQNGFSVATQHSAGCTPTTGYTPEDYRRRPFLWFEMVHPEDRERVRSHVNRVLANEQVPPIEHRIIRKDGGIRWVRDTVVCHFDENQTLIRYDGLVEDITERRLAEQRMRLVLESAPDAMVLIDERNRILFANARTEDVFGYERENLMDCSVQHLFLGELPDLRGHANPGGAPSPAVHYWGEDVGLLGRRKDGSVFVAELVYGVIDSEQGRLIVATIRDLTERQRAAELIRERDAELLAAQKIQQHILPNRAPRVPGLEFAACLFPAAWVAGDYYDYLHLPDDSWGVVVADVCGHGFSAALLASATSAHLRSFALHHADIHQIVRHVNSLLCRETEIGHFVTMLFLQIDPQSRALRYLNLGHPAGYVLDQAGELKARLVSGGLPLAIDVDRPLPPIGSVDLAPQDVIVMTTDGLLEAASPRQTFFGPDRLLQVVRAHRHQSAEAILAALQEAVYEFTGKTRLVDDLTALIIKVGEQA